MKRLEEIFSQVNTEDITQANNYVRLVSKLPEQWGYIKARWPFQEVKCVIDQAIAALDTEEKAMIIYYYGLEDGKNKTIPQIAAEKGKDLSQVKKLINSGVEKVSQKLVKIGFYEKLYEDDHLIYYDELSVKTRKKLLETKYDSFIGEVKMRTGEDVRKFLTKYGVWLLGSGEVYQKEILSLFAPKVPEDSIKNLDLSVRAYNALARRFKYISEVKAFIENGGSLNWFRGMGEVSEKEILQKLYQK